MEHSLAQFEAIVASFASAFTAPTAKAFVALVCAWAQCLGRPTARRLALAGAGEAGCAASAFARFFRRSRWDLDDLWRHFVADLLVPALAPEGRLALSCDDTTCAKPGRCVALAGMFLDAARSAAGNQVKHRAHCWVVMSLQVLLPFCNRVVGIPVMARLYVKKADAGPGRPFKTRQQLALEMARKLAEWLPGREIEVVADGAYPSGALVEALRGLAHFVSRMRRDAVLYGLPARPAKRGRGRPRQRGERLPKPEKLAAQAKRWKRVKVLQYGKVRERLVWTRKVLWWSVARERPVLLVVVRDPEGKEADDFFFTTDLDSSAKRVAESFAGRWTVEEDFREAKQLFGFSKVMGWSEPSVERQAPFALLVLSLVKYWHIKWIDLAERPAVLPSTAQMLADLREAFWARRINGTSMPNAEKGKIIKVLRMALDAAA